MCEYIVIDIVPNIEEKTPIFVVGLEPTNLHQQSGECIFCILKSL
jgi:hypothetical protein